MSARDVDMRSDIWSLGVICFEPLTGKLPFFYDARGNKVSKKGCL